MTTILYVQDYIKFKELIAEQKKLGLHKGAKIKLYRYNSIESIKWCKTCQCKRIPEDDKCPICLENNFETCIKRKDDTQ